MKGNYFVDGDWGGVDDISFAGEAEPMAYEDFIAMEGLPERFRSFYLTYMANGAVVDLSLIHISLYPALMDWDELLSKCSISSLLFS